MNREMLFRGQPTGKGGIWMVGIGAYKTRTAEHLILDAKGTSVEVVRLCQYTGLKDKNGKKIFEGDIVRLGDDLYYFTFNIEFGSFMAARVKGSCGTLLSQRTIKNCGYAIMGNVYDNPELMKQNNEKEDNP